MKKNIYILGTVLSLYGWCLFFFFSFRVFDPLQAGPTPQSVCDTKNVWPNMARKRGKGSSTRRIPADHTSTLECAAHSLGHACRLVVSELIYEVKLTLVQYEYCIVRQEGTGYKIVYCNRQQPPYCAYSVHFF